jgi:hypothetical protein
MPKDLHDKALKLGASDFGYSKNKNKKYFVVYDGKTVNFGQKGYSDFTKHKDPQRRKAYRQRHGVIKTKEGKLAYKDKNQPAYWSWNLLWS